MQTTLEVGQYNGAPFGTAQSQSERELEMQRHIKQTPLFGAAPAGLEDLYTFYTAQISARIFAGAGHQSDSKPIIIGLGLPRESPAASSDAISDRERERFNVILALLDQPA